MRRAPVIVVHLFALLGVGALALALALASPLHAPEPMESIRKGALAIDMADAPPLRSFVARDGTALAYRVYAPAGAPNGRTIVVIHGSAGHSLTMNAASKAFAQAGFTVYALDMRGHGASGTRGDVAYVGQSEDDLVDFLDAMRFADKPLLFGHSMGGGFAARIALGPDAGRFDRFILGAPFLGRDAPSTRPSGSGGQWASVDVPRIVALSILHQWGLSCCDGLPVIAFGLPPDIRRYVTTRYSYRLLASFGVKDLRYRDLAAAQAPIEIVAGADDELMASDRYADIAATSAQARARVVPAVDHMGLVRAPAGLAALVAAARGEAPTGAAP